MIPSRSDIIKKVADRMYVGRVINNTHRGDVVEMMVLLALGEGWEHVGLGWHSWDLQRGKDATRQRIQVKQTAALQLWDKTVSQSLSFGWKPNPPSDFHRYNPGEAIEDEGWFCELFVFGVHDETDKGVVDQADPSQWRFLVVPTSDLAPRTKTMGLAKAQARWKSVDWSGLRQAVEDALA